MMASVISVQDDGGILVGEVGTGSDSGGDSLVVVVGGGGGNGESDRLRCGFGG